MKDYIYTRPERDHQQTQWWLHWVRFFSKCSLPINNFKSSFFDQMLFFTMVNKISWNFSALNFVDGLVWTTYQPQSIRAKRTSVKVIAYRIMLYLLNGDELIGIWYNDGRFQLKMHIEAILTEDFAADKSTLAEIMAWCRQATGNYLSQCSQWYMIPCGVTVPQRITGLGNVTKMSMLLWLGPPLPHHPAIARLLAIIGLQHGRLCLLQ